MQNLNSSGTDVGTLADAVGHATLVFDGIPALLADTNTYTPGTVVRTSTPSATYRVVDASVVPHLVTSGGGNFGMSTGPM